MGGWNAGALSAQVENAHAQARRPRYENVTLLYAAFYQLSLLSCHLAIGLNHSTGGFAAHPKAASTPTW